MVRNKVTCSSCEKSSCLWLFIFMPLVALPLHNVYAENQNGYIQYEIDDDHPSNKFIGNIVYDSDLEMKYSSDILEILSYRFLTQGIHLDYFSLDELSGNIKSIQTVDRDFICPGLASCAIRLDIAVQPPQYFEVIKAVVYIKDKNDNQPIFPSSSVTYEFPESTTPGILLTPIDLAKDIDSPRYGVVKYKLKSDTDVFELDVKNSTGSFELHLKLSKALDRETTDYYQLFVLAKDGGRPSKTGTLTVNIYILDINDNNPKFESSTYEVNTPENLRPGTSIITIEASDDDVGVNGNVIYSFSQQTIDDIKGMFTIERISGMIYLRKTLDYETRSSYSLIVVAQDEGENSLPANTRVLVNVMDVNDHVPSILINNMPEDGIFRINENQQPEVFVVHISILDEDDNNNGHVECFLSGHKGKFQIVEIYDKEFKVVTTRVLDREAQRKYNLNITCRDYGSPQLTTEETLTIHVSDLNDNKPEFSQENYNIVIEEHTPKGTSVLKVTAVDLDSGANGEITYSIDESDAHLFRINSITGEIIIIADFDREDIPQKIFHVIATDHGKNPKSSSATVVMNILDIDDQLPMFILNKYYMNVSENAREGTLVGYVKAVDTDEPQHSEFTYFLEAGQSALDSFRIDPTSGQITTKRPLDREYQSSYKLYILAQSDASPNTGDSTVVEVTILDKNDNPPQFVFPSFTKNTTVVSNQQPVGSIVTTIIALDADLGDNGLVSYYILEGNEDKLFQLDLNNGDLTVNKDLTLLEKKTKKIYLKVVAKDNGTPTNRDIGMLYITINESAPLIVSPPQPVQLFSMSSNLLAVIVGCVCGATVIMLAVVLAIIIIVRRRKHTHNNHISWYTTHPSTTPSKDDLVIDDLTANGHLEMSQKLVSDSTPMHTPSPITDANDKLKHLINGEIHSNGSYKKCSIVDNLKPIGNGDIRTQPLSMIQNTYIPPAPLTPSTKIPEEKDNDSGCADLSQGSNDEHGSGQTAAFNNKTHNTLQQQYQQSHSTAVKQLHQHTIPNHKTSASLSSRLSSLTPTTPSKYNILSQQSQQQSSSQLSTLVSPVQDYTSAIGSNINSKYKSNTPHAMSRPYIEPSNVLLQHQNPSLQQSFAEWLNSEGEQLKNQGNKYWVGNQHNTQRSRSPHTFHFRGGSGNSKKTVRFTEPEQRRRLQILNSVGLGRNVGSCSYMGPSTSPLGEYSQDPFLYKRKVKPSTSDGNIYKNMCADDDDGNDFRLTVLSTNYGSLDRRRKNHISNDNINRYFDRFHTGQTNDGSLV